MFHGVHQRHVLADHEVGEEERGWATPPHHAVHQQFVWRSGSSNSDSKHQKLNATFYVIGKSERRSNSKLQNPDSFQFWSINLTLVKTKAEDRNIASAWHQTTEEESKHEISLVENQLQEMTSMNATVMEVYIRN